VSPPDDSHSRKTRFDTLKEFFRQTLSFFLSSELHRDLYQTLFLHVPMINAPVLVQAVPWFFPSLRKSISVLRGLNFFELIFLIFCNRIQMHLPFRRLMFSRGSWLLGFVWIPVVLQLRLLVRCGLRRSI